MVVKTLARRLLHVLRIRHARTNFHRIDPRRATGGATTKPMDDGGDVLEVGRATLEEAGGFPDYFDSWLTRREILANLAAGHQLFIGRLAGEAVAFRWARVGKARIPMLDLDCELPAGVTLLTGGYTRPTHRRRGFSTILYAEIMKWLRDSGQRLAIVNTSSGHEASPRTYRRYGFEPYLEIDYLRLLILRVYVLRPIGGPRAWCITFGKRAPARMMALLLQKPVDSVEETA